jgi:septal ring factor EnvC (AmiA/AmiB activator)
LRALPPADRRILACLIAALWLGGPLLAQPPAPEARLKELESALQKGEERAAEVRRRAQVAAEAAEKTRIDMVATARAVQEHEDSLSELEAQLNDLGGLERDRASALDRKRQQLNAVLTALERLAFRPSAALIAQPTSPAETVRSAILLKDVVPRIEAQVAALRADIEGLAAVRTDIARQQKLIAAAAARLDQEHQRLTTLYSKKQQVQEQTESERQAMEQRLKAMAGEAEDLRDLLTRLEEEKKRREQEALARASAEKAAREAELAAEKAAKEAQAQAQKAQREAEAAAARAAKQKREQELAEMKQAREAERQARLAAQEAEQKAKAAAREAALAAARTAQDQREKEQRANRPFSRAQGDMPFPARGKIVVRFGQSDEQQALSKGVTIETRPGAQVVAPYNGQVVFAGPFRGYGLLLIIEHGEGYHTLLAGMARIDGTVGQRLATGEPVGVMGQTEAKPLLYVEFRHNGQPVNPLPWLTARKAKVSG